MFNIYYKDLEHIDKVFAPYILTSLQEKKRVQLKVLKKLQNAYKNCYHNIARYIRKKEKTKGLKAISTALELVIKKECRLLATNIQNITTLSLIEMAFIALSPLARIKLDLLVSMSEEGRRKRGEFYDMLQNEKTSTISIVGEEKEAFIELLHGIQRDILAEAELIAKSVLEKTLYFNGKEFNISARIWNLSNNNIEVIKSIIKAGIDVDEKKIAPILQAFAQGGGKLITQYPLLKRRLGKRFNDNTTYNAYRLINNEMADIFFNTSLQDYQKNEYVEGVKWLLSNNRNKEYEKDCDCSDYAYQNIHGLGAGIYPPGAVPARPHILCQCSLAPISSRRLKRAIEGKEELGNTPSKEWLEWQAELMRRKEEELLKERKTATW